MSAISIGRIVTKTMGREAGKKAVVTRIIDNKFAEITGPFELTGVKRRRVNVSHIEPSKFKLEITIDSNSDDEILKLLDENKEIKSYIEA